MFVVRPSDTEIPGQASHPKRVTEPDGEAMKVPSSVFSFKEAAAHLHISKAHLSSVINGKVPGFPPVRSFRLGRRVLIKREWIDKWIDAFQMKPGARWLANAGSTFHPHVCGVNSRFFRRSWKESTAGISEQIVSSYLVPGFGADWRLARGSDSRSLDACARLAQQATFSPNGKWTPPEIRTLKFRRSSRRAQRARLSVGIGWQVQRMASQRDDHPVLPSTPLPSDSKNDERELSNGRDSGNAGQGCCGGSRRQAQRSACASICDQTGASHGQTGCSVPRSFRTVHPAPHIPEGSAGRSGRASRAS